jgi:cell division protein FtsN
MDRSGTGSNNPPIPIEVLQPAPSHEDTTTTVMAPISPKKKMAVKKKLTPNQTALLPTLEATRN